MTSPVDDEEPPLDPTLLRVQAKLRRLILIGGLTLGLGIAAVLFAVIYRIVIADSTDSEAVEAAAIAAAEVELGAGAELVALALDGGRMALAFRDGDAIAVILVDTETMAVTGRLTIADQGRSP